MTDDDDPDTLRGELLDRWERSASGWSARRERVRAFGMPVSRWKRWNSSAGIGAAPQIATLSADRSCVAGGVCRSAA